MRLTGDEIGHDAGWHLAFSTEAAGGVARPALSIGAGDYHAEITAALPGGLDGGNYRFVVEGITNAHYKALHDVWSARPRTALFVDLYLYWRDTGGPLGYLASLAGLTDTVDALAGTPPADRRVARLVVTRLSRRAGTHRYEAVIEACERVFGALGERLARSLDTKASAVASAAAVARELGVAFEEHPLAPPPGTKPRPGFETRAGRKGTTVLNALEGAMRADSKRSGLPMYVIRDGTLHIGPARRIPLAGDAKPLDARRGLVHVETTGRRSADQADEPAPSTKQRPSRLEYSLTLLGRPDLRPGDTVTFADPFTDRAGDPIDPGSALAATTTPSSFVEALGGLGSSLAGGAASAIASGNALVYVTSVSHRLGRSEGFVTTVAGVGIERGSEWDPAPPEPGLAEASPPAAGTHEELAGAIHDLVRSARPEPFTAGEIRAMTTTGTDEPPAQTVDVWVGLRGDDGQPHAVRRLDIDRDRRSRRTGVPYVTPFAWGKCGLVLPRYPGTRVLLASAGGVDDPVDLGALWESGHGPDSRPGDYWLSLPAAVDTSVRQSLADDDTAQEPTAAASNDLIDADGQRTIEVGRFILRVQPNKLRVPGERPDEPADGAEQVTIEHESGSRIVIKDNGDIVIESAADVVISAKHRMTLEADDVAVKVKNAMNVEDR